MNRTDYRDLPHIIAHARLISAEKAEASARKRFIKAPTLDNRRLLVEAIRRTTLAARFVQQTNEDRRAS